MTTANRSEYLTIDNVPLSTEAWTTEDISELLSGPETRGRDLLNPARTGELARRRALAARTVAIPMVVNGYVDSDGTPHADPRAGLISNLDELKAILTPRSSTLAGTRTLQWVNEDSGITREAQVHVSPAIASAALGPHAVRIVVQMTLPGGVLRDVAETMLSININHNQTTKTSTITVPGTFEVQDARIEYDGSSGDPSANSFKITNLTYDAGGGVYLHYDDTVSDPLTIYAEDYSATLGATEVGGSIISAGSSIWLPLLPGANSIRVDIPGNTVNSHVHIHVKGVWT
jgi:hypothetical protein